MGRPWRSHVDFACPECGQLLVACDVHFPADRACLACAGQAKLIGIGSPTVGNARWFRCLACSQLHMLRRNEFVNTGERAGTEEFGGLSSRL
jgi:predicted RNA-binding Zn-ribbon protein involved in translation (DUF1610 family)